MPMGMVQANKPLIFDTFYEFFVIAWPPEDPFMCDEGWMLAWIGTVTGSFEGNIYYCMHDTADPAFNRLTGITNHWEDAYWEIWVDGEMVIQGWGGGSSTLLPPTAKKAANWRAAKGVITDAGEGYEEWIGRPFHDGGDVVGVLPEWSGEGKLVIH